MQREPPHAGRPNVPANADTHAIDVIFVEE
jgi:hypothetical protein